MSLTDPTGYATIHIACMRVLGEFTYILFGIVQSADKSSSWRMLIKTSVRLHGNDNEY